MSEASPYQAIALFYDRIMSHVNYPRWANHIRLIWRRYGSENTPSRILEFGAGTCRFAAPPIFPTAFAVHTDPSITMLMAALNSNPPPPKPPYRVACDARFPAFKGNFDLVMMMYDSFNYLLTPDDVSKTLQAVKRRLRRNGLFIFDVTTEYCSKRYFSNSTDTQDWGNGTYIRHSMYDANLHLQLNLFTFFLPVQDGNFERHEEIHSQRIYPIAAIKQWAEAEGFVVADILSGFSFRPGTDRSERLHFVLRKP